MRQNLIRVFFLTLLVSEIAFSTTIQTGLGEANEDYTFLAQDGSNFGYYFQLQPMAQSNQRFLVQTPLQIPLTVLTPDGSLNLPGALISHYQATSARDAYSRNACCLNEFSESIQIASLMLLVTEAQVLSLGDFDPNILSVSSAKNSTDSRLFSMNLSIIHRNRRLEINTRFHKSSPVNANSTVSFSKNGLIHTLSSKKEYRLFFGKQQPPQSRGSCRPSASYRSLYDDDDEDNPPGCCERCLGAFLFDILGQPNPPGRRRSEIASYFGWNDERTQNRPLFYRLIETQTLSEKHSAAVQYNSVPAIFY